MRPTRGGRGSEGHRHYLLPAFLHDVPSKSQSASQTAKVCEAVPRYRPGLTLAELEREAIQNCLIQTGGNRQRTAELLGISTRTLLRKIRTCSLEDPLRPPTPGSNGNGSSRLN